MEIRKFSKGQFSDNEINEIRNLIDFDFYLNSEEFDFVGNVILTKDLETFDNVVENMCCGIFTTRVKLADNTIVYFGFDYGH